MQEQSKRPRLDLAGQRFGALLVLDITGTFDSRQNRLWLCRCDCGRDVERPTVDLRNGKARDCGHSKAQPIPERQCATCARTFKPARRTSRYCSLACRDGSLIGQRFGRLTVLSAAPAITRGLRSWECRCDCGKLTTAKSTHLLKGATKSCGCLVGDSNRRLKTRHGQHGTKEYASWHAMKQRCLNPRHKSYADYGGRGITIDDAWIASFEQFLADIGPAPSPHHSIDRIDNDGHYEPGNVRWATPTQQTRNQRRNQRYTYDGRTLTVSEWSELTAISEGTLAWRLANGWSIEDALTTPVRGYRSAHKPPPFA